MIRMFMRWRLNPDDERGATVVIVVLSLVAMFGMLVLVVDVGGLLWKRRELVNGSDSGALAAAKTCADEADTTAPEDQADTYAIDNVGNLDVGDGGIIDIQGCDSGESGFVTVQYHQDQKLYFAQVLGFGSTNGVTTKATAAWGPLGGGNVVPLVIEQGTLQGPCDIPGTDPVDPDNPKTCPLWYNNNDLGNADWGFMNLDQWGVAPDANCSNAGAARKDWIENDYHDPLLLNGDPPGSDLTYVCVDTGFNGNPSANSDWGYLFDRMQTNPIILVPVNDCGTQVDKTGALAPCPATPDKYSIIGFVKLKLTQVLRGNDDSLADGTPCAVDCGGTPPTPGTCNNVGLPGASNLGAYGQGGWLLDPLAVSTCGASTPPDSITNVVVTNGLSGTNKVIFNGCIAPAAGCDYIYDPTATPHQLDWFKLSTRPPGPNSYKISFDWSINGIAPTPGICRPHTKDSNAICLQMAYLGFSTAGSVVGNGELFGAFGYVLCDRDLGTCPDQ